MKKQLIRPLLGVAIAATFALVNVNKAKANNEVAPMSLKLTTSQSFKATVDAAPPGGWYVLFGSGYVLIVK
jgi:hypothetical protein